MDFSNYPKDHPRYDGSHANKLGYWKDEAKGDLITEFIGLASKTYSMRVLKADGKEVDESKCKGVGKGFRKRIPFDEFKKCIDQITSHRENVYSIQSQNHVIRTMKSDRQCFSSFDDKRYVLKCGRHSLAHGHYRIPCIENCS